MKKCPLCQRTYADGTLSYCLDDGAVLFDPEATQVFSAAADVPPTMAYIKPTPPAPMPTPAPVFTPVPAPAPVPKQRSWLALGAMIVAVLAVGVAIGSFIIQRSSPSASDSSSASPAPRTMNSTAAATPVKASPTPTPTPKPSPVVTPTPNVVQSPTEREADCVLYNDKADKAEVRVRANCDTQDCDNDKNTIAGQYPDHTPVRVIKGSSVQGTRFRWVQVAIKSSGERVWVASSKIKCD